MSSHKQDKHTCHLRFAVVVQNVLHANAHHMDRIVSWGRQDLASYLMSLFLSNRTIYNAMCRQCNHADANQVHA